MDPQSSYNGIVVVLDDEPGMCRAMTKLLTLEGFHVTAFPNAADALEYLSKNPADVLLTDMRMPQMSGREVIAALAERRIPVEVVVMTGQGSVENAVECLKAGAFDYVLKPVDHRELAVTLRRAMQTKRLKDMNRALTQAYNAKGGTDALLGDAPSMRGVRALLERVAPADSAVLILGESGTGKELAARAIHKLSPRANGRFVAINCGAIPETLLESELFGHERGAFTGATDTKVGLIEVADGGTLFLDEIGELPLGMQAKLLRVLQEHEISRVGGIATIPVNIRLVCATNRNLEDRIRAGHFREDLFYRINVIQVLLPPLRARAEDIPLLANSFLAENAQRFARPKLRLAPEAAAHLATLPFPGNVRELRNLVERLAVLADEDTISLDTVRRLTVQAPQETSPAGTATGAPSMAGNAEALLREFPDFRDARDHFEREYLKALLKQHSGSVTNAAKHAGISRRSLYEKIDKLGIILSGPREEE